MKGFFKLCTALLVGLLVTTVGFWAGYELYKPNNTEPMVYANDLSNIPLSLEDKEVIKKNTVIRYVYKYIGDGISEVYEDLPADYMLGLDKEGIEKEARGWQIVKFDTEVVELEKTVEGDSAQHYVLKVGEDGYIEVYYTKNGDIVGLRERTNTPVDILNDEFKEKIAEGYTIVGRDNLNDLLENLES